MIRTILPLRRGEKKKEKMETGFDPRGKSLWLSIMNPSLTPAPAGNMELCSDSTSTLETLAESVPDVSEDTEEGFWSGTVLESFIRLSISAGDFFPCAA